MGFVRAGLTGLALAAMTVALLALGILQLTGALRKAEASGNRGTPQERVFAVTAGTAIVGDLNPRIESFGRVRSARSLTLSSRVAGRVVEIGPDLRPGATVAAGALLARIDPADYRSALDTVALALAEAEAEAAEARQSVRSATIELDAARTQRHLRSVTLERQQGLAQRGVAAPAAVDEATLALLAAEQVVAGREQALLTAELRIPRADLAAQRARLTLADAERRLADTEIRAPFAGIVSALSAAAGDLLAANESFGTLIDPTRLEVALHLTATQFARLQAADGSLPPLPVTVLPGAGRVAPPGAEPASLAATLDRPAAEVAEGRTGREVFARLDVPTTLLRPGDFVGVRLEEPPLRGVTRLPASAVSENGFVLLVGPDNRLVEQAVRILRREGEGVVVAGLPADARFVTVRRPALGPGVLVRSVGGEPDAPRGRPEAARRQTEPGRG